MKAGKKKLIVGSIITVILISVFALVESLNSERDRCNDKKAKYIFLFIGDGMGTSHINVTESYLSYKAGKKGGEHLSFTQFPGFGMMTTYSADRNITCSSAAGTAIACGKKTNNSYIGISPEGDSLKSIAFELREKGYKIGIMSSVPVNHATPASFYAHNTNRYDYYGVTKEIPQSGFEFFSGSGFIDYFGKDGQSRSSKELMEEQGYKVYFSEEEFDHRPEEAEKIILCQPAWKDKNAGNYKVDPTRPDNIPPDEMLECCLKFLGDDDPFFIMYEGGEIDWAAHSNKTMPMIDYILNFEKAVNEALDFYKSHPDETLIIVTADHETGGISLGGTPIWEEVNIGWRYIDSVYTASGRKNHLEEDENKLLNDKAYIGWTTHSHTGGAVPVYAIGKGYERFSGLFDNTDIKGKLLAE